MKKNSIGLLLSFSLVTYAYADTLTSVPSTALPDRIDQRIRPQKVEKEKVPLSTPSLAKTVLPSSAEKIKFPLNTLIIKNATVFTTAELKPLYQHYLGKVISLANLQEITNAITAKYRNEGYILSRAIIPPQHIRQGIVTLEVIEGYIDQVALTGNAMGSSDLLLAYAKHIAEVHPLNIKRLENYALLANDLPGYRVKTVLTPSAATSGASDLILVAEPYRSDGYISYDNRGTRYLGPEEVILAGNLNSILRGGDRTGFRSLVTGQPQELRFFELTHEEPIGTNGMRLSFSAQNTHTEPGYTLRQFNVLGRAQDYSTRLTYPVIRSRESNLSLSGIFDAMNSSNSLLGTQFYLDNIRSLRLGVNYDRIDSLRGFNQFSMAVSQGVNAFGASNHNDDNLSRADGRPEYLKFNAEVSRLQGLVDNFSLLVSVAGQYSDVPLLASEQFSYGGSQYGRAYDASEITGDRGMVGKAELRYNSGFNLRFLQSIQYYGFYDGGVLYNINIVNQLARQTGVSAGVGARFNFTPHLIGSLELAKPLTLPVAALAQQGGNGNRPRVFFSLTLFGDSGGYVAKPVERPPIQTLPIKMIPIPAVSS